jgi:hypothetical protein
VLLLPLMLMLLLEKLLVLWQLLLIPARIMTICCAPIQIRLEHESREEKQFCEHDR